MTSPPQWEEPMTEQQDDKVSVLRAAKLKALRAALDPGEASPVMSGDVLARVLAKLRSTNSRP